MQIDRYDAKAGTHTLYYEDGEIRDSDMSQRGFRVCYRPPAQTPLDPTRQDGAVDAATGATKTSTTTEPSLAGQQQQQDAGWGRRRPPPLAPRPPADYAPDTSMYVLAALNRFGESGGMAPLAQRLSSGRASFGEVLETFRLGKALKTHASSRSIKKASWVLKECAAAALLSVPPESMRAATKAEIAECVSSVRELALTLSGAGALANPPVVLLQELEQLELAMAMKVRWTYLLSWAGGGRGGGADLWQWVGVGGMQACNRSDNVFSSVVRVEPEPVIPYSTYCRSFCRGFCLVALDWNVALLRWS